MVMQTAYYGPLFHKMKFLIVGNGGESEIILLFKRKNAVYNEVQNVLKGSFAHWS